MKQTYDNWEIIVCDNNSTDNTVRLIKNLIKEDERLKIIQKKDSGVAEALNTGFNLSSGQILCWLNSDDLYLSKNALEIVNNNLQDKYGYLNSNFLNINSENIVIKSFYSFIPKYKIKKLFYFNQIFTGSFFFTKKVYEKFNGFNLSYKYSFEYEIIIHCLKNFKGIHINKFLSCFRILPGALSSNKTKLNTEFAKIIYRENLKYNNNYFLRILGMLMSGNLHLAFINKFYDKRKGKKI